MSINEDDDAFIVPILSFDIRTKKYIASESQLEMVKHLLKSLLQESDIEDAMLLVKVKGAKQISVARPVILDTKLLEYTCEYVNEMNRLIDILSNQFVVNEKVQ